MRSWRGEAGGRGKILLGGAALAAVALALLNEPPARAAGILTQGAASSFAPVASSVTANLASAQAAQAAAIAAQNQLARVTSALQAMQNFQASAHTIAQSKSSAVPDGLSPGGLVPDSGLAATGTANAVTDWTGAQTPTQTSSAGATTVNINQTAAQAILSWNSFNVSPKTTVAFNQQGNANWVALNKIAASGVPSQILGSIKASGQVYLINQSGIIFGGAAQINVGALIASSADLSDSQFLSNGIYSTQSGTTYAPSFTNAGGAITVAPGAMITTSAPAAVTDGGGYVLLLGTVVQNGGDISTPDGQAELAAGDNFLLRPGYGTSSNPISTTRGNEVAALQNKPGSSLTGGSGLVVNTGLITAATGDITMDGETVAQDGVLLSTTSVDTRGTIHLLSSASDPDSSVTLGGNGYTLVEPDLASTATELDSQRAALIAASAVANGERASQFSPQFDDLSQLPDEQDLSRIEIVTGGSVDFQNGSDTSTPGGQVAVAAASRVQADSGALIDASGSYAVPMAMSSNDIEVSIQSFNLRDDPQNRLTGNLKATNVFVDDRDLSLVPASSAYDADRDYTAGGLLEVSGYLANIGHTIGEYSAIGGTIALSTGSSGAIVAESGATFDINGGSLQYQGGELAQSYLLGANGHLYNVNSAPAGVTYAGVYDGFTVEHPTWNVTQVYANVLTAPPEIYQAGYTEGRAAGSLTLSSPTTVFDGTIEAAAVNGPLQIKADPAGVSDSYLLTQNEVAEPGSLAIGTLNGASLLPADTEVSFSSAAPAAGGLATPVAASLTGTTILSAPAIDASGLGGLSVITDGGVNVTAALALAPGANVALLGSSVAIGASVTAPGGSFTAGQVTAVGNAQITLQNPNPPAGGAATGDTTLAPGAAISTAGIWTNLLLDSDLTFTQAFASGGAVSLGSVNNVTLGAGSLIDTAAGGVITATGAQQGGAGGAISLAAATPSNAIPNPTGNLTLGGTLDAAGVTKGGALTLSAPSFDITSAAPATADPSVVTLDPAFFGQGFSAYNLEATGDITVSPGTAVNVTEPTYQISMASTAEATGAAQDAVFTLALTPLYTTNSTFTSIARRAGASFSASIVTVAGAPATLPTLSIGTGASVTVDPGQAINLAANGQITIDGALTAPGGTISAVSSFASLTALANGPGTVSVWLGGTATLNAGAVPVTFASAGGRIISLAPSGGSITLGSNASTASVIINAGAVVEASGSAAVDEFPAADFTPGEASALAPDTAIPVEGAGGAIALASREGLYNDGTLIAAAGGPDAAGGNLSMTLDADQVLNAGGTELTPRLFTITQTDPGPLLPAGLLPGEASPALVDGAAQISAQQITSGGFGSVTLFSRDAFVFQGDVSLTLKQSLTLQEGYITDSSATGAVTLSAPYITLSGSTPDPNAINNNPLQVISGYSAQAASGVFTVNAGELDLAATLRFGGVLPAQGTTPATDLAGFGTVNLNSAGDLRFDQSPAGFTSVPTNLVTEANLNLSAREIYAMTTASESTQTTALIVAGYDPTANLAAGNGNFYADGLLTVSETAGATAAAPDTIGGELLFDAATVRQGGTLWQPLGILDFGALGTTSIGGGGLYNLGAAGDPNTAVDFLPGSLTSVSAAGLTIPYGGTTDGVTYDVNGVAVKSSTAGSNGLPTVTNGVSTGTISIAALSTDVQAGAVLDLRGGGTLAGAGFISGQGGSADVLTSPLLQDNSSGVTQPGLGADQVYAIVAGPQPAEAAAYTQTGANGSSPKLGASIIIPAGVPGLAAGVYTLLPAYYALTPGGYRVELDGAASVTTAAVTALPNGSYAVAGFTALAGTNVRGTLPSDLTITPGATVETYSEYDQEGYAGFLIANAATYGGIRPELPIDAGTLALNFPANSAAALTDAGAALLQAAAGGVGGTLVISGALNTAPVFDIYGAAPASGLAAGTVSLSAAQIDAFDAATIEIGAAGQGFTGAKDGGVTLQNGAVLIATRVVLTATSGGITLDSGAEIDTIGKGTLLADSTTLGLLQNGGASVLDVGNGYLTYSSAVPSDGSAYGPITVRDGATILSDGSIAFSTDAAVNIGVNAVYGGKYLDLDVPEINIGDPAALGATAPAGLLLTQAVLQTLTQGDAALAVPAAEILDLTATDSLNFYGTTALDLTGSNVQLVINTPAIYGFGGASDVATISADTIVWNGVSAVNPVTNVVGSSAPGGTVTNGPGSGAGTLDLDAQTIIFGYSSLDEPLRDVPLDRLTAGFATVNLNASTAITANNQGSLSVYESVPDFGQAGTGGTLNVNTPLLTAGAAATIGFTAGGNVNVLPLAGVADATALASPTAGGEVDLTGQNIDIEGAVILPSGKLDLQAAGGITLGAASLVDLAGETTTNVDQTVYGFGGSLIADSAGGDVTQDAGGIIDVNAAANSAGSIAISADAAAAGQVALLGTLNGGANAGFTQGSFSVSAQNFGDFEALNNSLDAGDFDAARSFDLKQGDLAVGNGVQAQKINISVDHGSLFVTGLIDASDVGGGSISLSAANDLTIAGTADLDAHGTSVVVDSYGVPIPSANAPTVNLTTTSGELTLASGAQINLASADGVARGDLELNVPRLTSATSGDANVSAASGLNIDGAATIAVNAFWTYNGLTDPNNPNDALITQAYLDKINTTDTEPFMAAAANNADLAARVADLGAYSAAYHFRPGVQIVSATAGGDLTIEGDIDLLAYRYGAGVVAGQPGTGEPGVLSIRAGGNLNIYGSVTDGFQDPIDDSGTEFAKGWVIFGGGEPYNENQVIPVAIEVAAGSELSNAAPVNFPVPIKGGSFQAGAVAPVALTLKGAQTTSVAFIATSKITDSSGATLFKQGQVVPAGTTLPSGAVIAAGGSLPFAVNVGGVTWPANTPFTVTTSLDNGNTGVVLASKVTLAAGAFIPGGSAITFVKGQPGLVTKNGVQMIETRAVGADSSQGQLYGLGAQLPAGDLSWSINLVSGADIAAANPDAVQTGSELAANGTSGNLVLADTHYGLTSSGGSEMAVPAFSVVRTGTGALTLASGGALDEDSSFGVYTAGGQSAAIPVDGQNPYDLAQGYGTKTSLLGNKNTAEAALVANYAAYYPTGGGNVVIDAQGGLNGFILTSASFDGSPVGLTDTDAVGNWLWRQGGAGQLGAWWVEYGSLNLVPDTTLVQYTGFQGIGTLGGGDLTVETGGAAGGLDLVVASNGRVTPEGGLVQNGGGTMNVAIGGALNFVSPDSFASLAQDAGGLIADLRGDTVLSAGSVGTVVPTFGTVDGNDPRFLPPLESETADLGNGIDLLPGDGTVTVATRGDLVIDGAGNPGTVQNQANTTPVNDPAQKIDSTSGGNTDFSLWTGQTGLDLFSAGGDVAPVESNSIGGSQNAAASDDYPPSLVAAAQSGNVYFGTTPVELAPAPDGQLELLAAGSIIGDGTILSMSGAAASTVATPFDPGITITDPDGVAVYTNYNPNAPGLLVDFGADTPTGPLHESDSQPALIYAATGDILNFEFGEISTNTQTNVQTLLAAKPFDIVAGRDIVDSGTLDSPDTFLNLSPTDITSVTAGRDIIESSFDIAGPGNLTVQAGRNIYLADQGAIYSLGPVFDIDPNDRNSGAGISVLAGVGAGPDYGSFSNLFLNPASTLGLPDTSSIVAGDDAALYTWLRKNHDYTGSSAGAYAYFLTLSGAQQAVFLRELYFTELNNSGLEFNEPSSAHYKSYILGQDAIAALFPTTGAGGSPITYTGDLTLFGDSGIHTAFGGNIETFTPGGQTIIGEEGITPPGSAGFITQGSGDIDIYSQGSVLLGESRVLTTFGGNIVIWSATGDINAGRGSKTSIDYSPLQRVYDNYGDVFLSPSTPSSGAGIATLNPIPAIPPGDINLVAPQGTVDAGEAGIRVSGNLNIAAAHVLNTANIQVQGTSTGAQTVSAPNVGALTSAGSTSGAAAQAAENATSKPQAAPLPSIWIVEILGYSSGGPEGDDSGKKDKKKNAQTT